MKENQQIYLQLCHTAPYISFRRNTKKVIMNLSKLFSAESHMLFTCQGHKYRLKLLTLQIINTVLITYIKV